MHSRLAIHCILLHQVLEGQAAMDSLRAAKSMLRLIDYAAHAGGQASAGVCDDAFGQLSADVSAACSTGTDSGTGSKNGVGKACEALQMCVAAAGYAHQARTLMCPDRSQTLMRALGQLAGIWGLLEQQGAHGLAATSALLAATREVLGLV